MNRYKKIIIVLLFSLLLNGCSKTYRGQLGGTCWYRAGQNDYSIFLFDNGTCELNDNGVYETTWSVENDNLLVISDYYGEPEIATIISVDDEKLVLEKDGEQIILWSSSNISEEEDNESSEENFNNGQEESKKYYLGHSDPVDGIMGEVNLCDYGYSSWQDGGDRYLGIMDSDGFFIPVDLEYSNTYSGFSGGYAYVNYNDGHFVIVDIEGNIIYESSVEEDTAYKIECGGDGYYLIKKEIKNFDTNEIFYGILSVKGEWIADFTSLDGKYSFTYCGDNILQVCKEGERISSFVDMKTLNYYTPAEKGESKYRDLVYIGRAGNEIAITNGILYRANMIEGTIQEIGSKIGDVKYGDNLFYIIDINKADNPRYVDWNGNIVIDLSQYEIINAESFINGYAALEIKGKDGNVYLTMIDKMGSFCFEPMKILKYGTFSDGYVTVRKDDDSIYIVNCEGETILYSEDAGHNIDLDSLMPVDGMIYDTNRGRFFTMSGEECELTVK